MKRQFRFHALWIAILAVTLFAMPVFAQVPQDMTYTGRLVDDLGDPLAGPVDLELRIFEDATGGTALYTEEHNGIGLDATGGFSVQLGLGASPSDAFDAELFSDVDRWLEVVVGTDVLTPRQIIGSVPWALIAEQANEIVRDPNAPRFEDCGDGTVADHRTGLQWEKKTGTVGFLVECRSSGPCLDPHHVNNTYDWAYTGIEPNGSAFTSFLARLNGDPTVVEATSAEATGDPASDPTVCFAHHCDWHLPAIGELRTILRGPDAAPGQVATCHSSTAPCIDPDFAAIGGPSMSYGYWSASPAPGSPPQGSTSAWSADLYDGTVVAASKAASGSVRAVRTGSCN